MSLGHFQTLADTVHRLTEGTVDLLFPKRCYGCGKQGHYVCGECFPTLPRLDQPYCQVCAEPLKSAGRRCNRCWQDPLEIDGIRSLFVMQEPVSRMVYALKYRNVRDLAQTLGAWLADYYRHSELSADILAPVPLHSRRERQRGYNQSLLLARVMGKVLAMPVAATALQRTRNTPQQARARTSADRRTNVADAFVADPRVVEGKRVLLIDDVSTTGATLEACAIALKEAGAISAWGLTLAREA